LCWFHLITERSISSKQTFIIFWTCPAIDLSGAQYWYRMGQLSRLSLFELECGWGHRRLAPAPKTHLHSVFGNHKKSSVSGKLRDFSPERKTTRRFQSPWIPLRGRGVWLPLRRGYGCPQTNTHCWGKVSFANVIKAYQASSTVSVTLRLFNY